MIIKRLIQRLCL